MQLTQPLHRIYRPNLCLKDRWMQPQLRWVHGNMRCQQVTNHSNTPRNGCTGICTPSYIMRATVSRAHCRIPSHQTYETIVVLWWNPSRTALLFLEFHQACFHQLLSRLPCAQYGAGAMRRELSILLHFSKRESCCLKWEEIQVQHNIFNYANQQVQAEGSLR